MKHMIILLCAFWMLLVIGTAQIKILERFSDNYTWIGWILITAIAFSYLVTVALEHRR